MRGKKSSNLRENPVQEADDKSPKKLKMQREESNRRQGAELNTIDCGESAIVEENKKRKRGKRKRRRKRRKKEKEEKKETK